MINQFKGNKSDYWNTPKDLYNALINVLHYKDYNPEGTYYEPFNIKTDNFKNERIFINPPFSILNKKEWLITIHLLIENNKEILLLMPARTDTKQFHKLLDLGFEVEFIEGRLKYNDKGPAPFPSVWMK